MTINHTFKWEKLKFVSNGAQWNDFMLSCLNQCWFMISGKKKAQLMYHLTIMQDHFLPSLSKVDSRSALHCEWHVILRQSPCAPHHLLAANFREFSDYYTKEVGRSLHKGPANLYNNCFYNSLISNPPKMMISENKILRPSIYIPTSCHLKRFEKTTEDNILMPQGFFSIFWYECEFFGIHLQSFGVNMCIDFQNFCMNMGVYFGYRAMHSYQKLGQVRKFKQDFKIHPML